MKEKMKSLGKKGESGQSLVIIALGLIAFVAILALVVDGANAYAAKRQAQNAADAGALAGATYMCKNHDYQGGIDVANDYAINRNGAFSAVVTANLGSGTVVVTATVERNTFFAGVIGFSQVHPMAVAAAECRPPVGMGVLPVAWACRETVTGSGIHLPGVACAQKLIKDCNNNPYDLNCTYILMDSVKVQENKKNNNCDPNITDPTNPNYCYEQSDLVCSRHLDPPSIPPNCPSVEPGTMDCDINNDCIDEIMTGGARSWLDLDGGGGGASELTNWIINGFPDPIPPHKWIPEESGVATSIFHTAASYVLGKDVILPVFNNICDHYPDNETITETLSACSFYPGWDNRDIAGPSTNYHIITFAEFHVTCVQTGRNKATAEAPGFMANGKDCNGHAAAAANEFACDPNPPHKCKSSIDVNDKTIEGYFKEVDLGGYSGPGEWNDTGTFTVVLTK